METIYFLLFIGFCIGIFAFAARQSKSKTDLERRRSHSTFRPASEKMLLPTDSRLVNKEEIWKARQQYASEGFAAPKPYVPKSELKAEAEYDGYSRRDRHHLTKAAKVKEEAHVESIKPEDEATTSFVAWKLEEDSVPTLDLRKSKTSAG
jgi:hypothetical protein